jgi:transposase/predicted transcriptional regulator
MAGDARPDFVTEGADTSSDEQSWEDPRDGRPWQEESRLRRLYIKEGLSTYDIAERLGCSRPTVSNWLERFGIERTGRQPEPCVLSDESLLRGLYVERGLSLSDVAQEAGCSIWKTRAWLRRHGIETRTPGEHNRNELLEDEGWLREQYVEKELSTPTIAEKADSSARTVSEWLRKHEIDIPRHLSEETRETLADPSRMTHLYTDRGLTGMEIAEELDCSATVVYEHLQQHGLTNYEMVGDDHPRWRGGEYAYGEGWNDAKREAVRDRDDNRCCLCGMTQREHQDERGSKLPVHHVRKARNVDDPEKRNGMGNLITLCHSCHSIAEKMTPELPEGIDDRR